MHFLIPTVLLVALQQSLTLAFIPLIRSGQYQVAYWPFVYVFLGLVTVLPLLIAKRLEPYSVRTCACWSLLLLIAFEMLLGAFEDPWLQYGLRIAEALPASMLSVFGRVYMARSASDATIAKAMPVVIACTSIAPFAAPLLGQALASRFGPLSVHVFMAGLACLSLAAVCCWWSSDRSISAPKPTATRMTERTIIVFIALAALVSSFEHLYVSDMTLVISQHYDKSVLIWFLYAGEAGILLGSVVLFMGLKFSALRSFSALAVFSCSMFVLLNAYDLFAALLLTTTLICFLLGIGYGALNARIVSLAREKPYFWSSLASFFAGTGIFVFSYFLEQRSNKAYPVLIEIVAYGTAAALFVSFFYWQLAQRYRGTTITR